MKRPLYRALACKLDAIATCKKEGNIEWLLRHQEAALKLVQIHMPAGAGIDGGVRLDLAASSVDKLVLHTAYHHMDENGGYDGWTEHTVNVYASLADTLTIRISGPDRNDIKEYLHEVFYDALRREVED